MHTVDIKSANVTATGDVYTARARLRSMVFRSTGAAAGKVELRNGGAAGALLLTLDAPAAAGLHWIPIPEAGILFTDGIHATLSNVDSFTAFFDG